MLEPSGRVIVLDPYCSPVSTFAYRHFHRELTDLHRPAFDDDAEVAGSPLDSNQARATLVFFRELGRFQELWPAFRVVERQRLALVAYPLSGGFTGRDSCLSSRADRSCSSSGYSARLRGCSPFAAWWCSNAGITSQARRAA